MNKSGDKILRFKDLKEKIGFSRTTVWRMMREGTFPLSRRISSNSRGWLASEVDQWIDSMEVGGCAPNKGLASTQHKKVAKTQPTDDFSKEMRRVGDLLEKLLSKLG